jgi:hypothetical protein
LVEVTLVPVALVQVRPVVPSVVTVAFAAEKLVVVTDVPVASVKVRPAITVVPVTVRLPWIVKSPVEVPPWNPMSFVVVLPVLVTVWKLGVVPEGQLVPSFKQTAEPFTLIADAFKVVPDAMAKPSQLVDVPFTKLRAPLVIEPIAAVFPNRFVDVTVVPFNQVPVAPVNVRFVIDALVPLPLVNVVLLANKLVVVTDVPVARAKFRFCKEVLPRTVNVEVTVVDAAINPPNK